MNPHATGDTGCFTLPGEAGYEAFTLEMARKWGADVIRDCDGTQLSDEILSSGYDIYSTVCMIREDNVWARKHQDKLQQNFLMSRPVTADGPVVTIEPIDGYFTGQFRVNLADDPREFWQVFDRTTGREVDPARWSVAGDSGRVTVTGCIPCHRYTVNFLAYRIWEEISMYNQITNHLDKERLMAVEPRYPETQRHLLDWLDRWCLDHPKTNVVRFTSMFYNFVWIWGADDRNRNLMVDWGSYDFSVNPLAIREFEREYGYRMTSEDFVNNGRFNITHNDPQPRYRDWMDFTSRFVAEFGRRCIDVVHGHGKKAYVFYDDSWIGVEPYGRRFPGIGFDGIIKCVFNGFETRLCAGVKGVATHEIRLHPYLFPTGLSGEPTFMAGGNPKLDAERYWVDVRRALLRVPIDRIGLGGYLHLVKPFPDFCDCIEKIGEEFRAIRKLHLADTPDTLGVRVAILTSWGSLRSWITSGNLHEHPELDLTNILEALSGLPLDVDFISFDDIRRHGIDPGISVIISAGTIDSAWSGGRNWEDPAVIERVAGFIAGGGGFIAVHEGTAVHGGLTYFSLSEQLGVDRDCGDRICSGRYRFDVRAHHFITECEPESAVVPGLFVLDGETSVLAAREGVPVLTAREYRTGRTVYWGGFAYTARNTRVLLDAILWTAHREAARAYLTTDNCLVDCALFPKARTLVVVNNSSARQQATVVLPGGRRLDLAVGPFDLVMKDV